MVSEAPRVSNRCWGRTLGMSAIVYWFCIFIRQENQDHMELKSLYTNLYLDTACIQDSIEKSPYEDTGHL